MTLQVGCSSISRTTKRKMNMQNYLTSQLTKSIGWEKFLWERYGESVCERGHVPTRDGSLLHMQRASSCRDDA